MMRTGLGATVVATLAAMAGVASAVGKKADPAEAPPSLAAVKSWAYQLQGADLDALARAPVDLIVIDYSRNGEDKWRLSAADVRRLKRKPDGGRRIVLAYMSIGEAEDYRFYWRDDWIETAEPDDSSGEVAGSPQPPSTPDGAQATTSAEPDRWVSDKAPAWLHRENDRWSGNFLVHYWEPEWQRLMFGSPDSYLARIMAAGFDGVYLDRVDAYYEFLDERQTAALEMVDFVARLAAHARAQRRGFLIVPQNGEELLVNESYVAVVDAIAKEDLLYGSPDEGEPNSPAQIANSQRWLAAAKSAGKVVLAVEYLADAAKIAAAKAELARLGYVAAFAPRALDHLVVSAP
jgi:cysteinyl-tRNA synthetase